MRKILLVDDELRITNFLTAFLTKEGFSVVVANSGQDGIDILRSDSGIDLMIVDMMMPVVTGADVIKEAKKIKKDLPFIVLTGAFDLEKYMGRLKRCGCSDKDIIYKPVDLAFLSEIIKKRFPS